MTLGKDEFNQVAGCVSNGMYPYYQPSYTPPKTRVVEETVTEEFDSDGKLVSRVKKTVTRYEENHNYAATWTSDIKF